jgi:MoaA/NifB/PqqE/SkfB family radical SAM enzyme/SAM-dependent methyltransferase
MSFAEGTVLHAPPLTYLERDRLHLAIDPEGPNWLATDARGERLLRLVDGRRTAGEIVGEYARSTGVDLGKAWIHAHAFLAAARRQGIVSHSPVHRSPYAGRLAEAPPAGLRELWLHTTNSCNLTCTHCLVSSHPQGERGLSAAALQGLARQAADLGVHRFYVTGGEPFVRDDSFDLIDLVTRELGREIIVLTNATLFSGARRKKLAALDRDRVRFQVSLDGATPETNDPLRGEGTFARIIAGLRTVTGLGFTASATCVVTSTNVDGLPDLAGLSHECGVKSLHLMWMHRRGRAIERLASLFPTNERLLELVRQVRARTGPLGIKLDNWESMLYRVNAPAGVKHDLGNAGWDSLCVYASGKVYPSAALANHAPLACGDACEAPLARIWEESELLRELRAASIARKADVRSDPLRFLTGGGDVEHAYMYAEAVAGKKSFLGPDPYYPLVRELALDAMFDLADRGRRARNPWMGFDAPLMFHGMGERSVDCATDLDGLDLEHPVRTLHSNCVLSFDVEKPHRVVQEFYGHAAEQPQAELCCPISHDPADVAHIPGAVLERFYGCGSPVTIAGVQAGETVVDLGSGGGIDCFIAARRVGPAGRVIGVDMTDRMLAVARENLPLVSQSLGYENVEFRKGYMEELPLADRSADLVTSNCVINLSPDKKAVFAQMWRILKDHGRAVVSDIVTEVPVPPALRINPRMWGECLSGALQEHEFLELLREAGFHGLAVLKKSYWKEVQGYRFFSVTVRGHKFEKKAGCVFIGQKALYRGPFEAVVDEEGHVFPRHHEVEICTDTAAKLTAAPYASMFTVLDALRRPIGAAPAGEAVDEAAAAAADTACCAPGGACG